MTANTPSEAPLPSHRATVAIFLAFAVAYFLSALLRAVTATLAPVFSRELNLQPGDLGLLGGAYFLGFAAMQLPLGRALDRFGAKRVLSALLCLAVLGCVGAALSESLSMLVAARVLTGVGVAACLMGPLTCYRVLLSPQAQLRANSWMLMTGSLGMLASTLPVQWFLPVLGWRGLFMVIAISLVLAMALIGLVVPGDRPHALSPGAALIGYRQIVRHRLFVQMAPLGFCLYGGLIAIQSLWAGPWLTRVARWPESAAAGGLFLINLCMLFTFLAWGLLMPRLAARGWGAIQVMTYGTPLSLIGLAAIVVLGPAAGAWHWAAWCVLSTVITLSQPALGQAFPASTAGRALSAFNLVVFGGVFTLQWGIGLVIGKMAQEGWSQAQAFQWAMGGFLLCCTLAYAWFLWVPGRRHR